MNAHGKRAENTKDKANLVNEQFESVFTSPETDVNHVPNGTSECPGMGDIDIAENGILKLLQSLKVYKTAGPDRIPAKELATSIAPILSAIYKHSYRTGEIPHDRR